MWYVWQPLLAAALAIAAGRPSAHARAPQPVAHIKNKIADWRYRKSTGLYERLAQGRESVTAAPVSKPVLLAPAGGWPQVDAAIKAGADAIYFGCATGFNARARATNFGEEELPVLMEKLHTAGLEGYMCLNVLVYESEMAEAERLARAAEAAGVDGLIVQDVGVASRLRGACGSADARIHAGIKLFISSSSAGSYINESGAADAAQQFTSPRQAHGRRDAKHAEHRRRGSAKARHAVPPHVEACRLAKARAPAWAAAAPRPCARHGAHKGRAW